MMRVAVIGGGITGLAAAHALATEPHAEVDLYEASPRVGGLIDTVAFCGVPVERGADAVVARGAALTDFISSLGIDAEPVAPAVSEAGVVHDHQITPLPVRHILGVPADLRSLLRVPGLSLTERLRAGADLILPRRDLPDDPSVTDFVAARLGRGAATRLVAPLVSAICAGNADDLSAAATTPDLVALAARERSLIAAVGHRLAVETGPTRRQFSFDPGLGSLVTGAEGRLHALGVRTHRDAPVESIAPDGAGFVVQIGGEDRPFDAIVLATPVTTTTRLLTDAVPDAADAISGIECASVAVTLLAYPSAEAPDVPGSGFLVPASEPGLITAVTQYSRKWAHRRPDGLTLIRCSVGRYSDRRFEYLDDTDLVATITAELSQLTHSHGAPSAWRVDRWSGGFPQYRRGHLDRVAQARRALVAHGSQIAIAGAGYDGIGIGACIASGRRAAALVAEAGRIS